VDVHRQSAEPWHVTLIDTGTATQTGGRIKRILPYVADEPFFAMTYGDGVADIDVAAEIAFHQAHGAKATVTAVQPAKRFGAISVVNDRVATFAEKPEGDGGWINGGFFLLSPSVGELIEGDDTIWERGPMEALTRANELRAYIHRGFWHPMDTLRDRSFLEEEWAGGTPQWRVW
jgi:glucose-1-phosphate cytidylyltransferase